MGSADHESASKTPDFLEEFAGRFDAEHEQPFDRWLVATRSHLSWVDVIYTMAGLVISCSANSEAMR